MEVTRKSKRDLRIQNAVFGLLFFGIIGLSAWLSTRYDYEADWTASGRHTLSAATVEVLKAMEGPVTLTAFAREEKGSPLRERISELVQRYRRYNPDIQFTFINPDLAPDRVQEMNVTMNGEVVVAYKGNRENLKSVGEEALTNALQRLARGGERKLVFITGHGERSPEGGSGRDLGQWVDQLKQRGITFETLSLTHNPALPEGTTAVVIAGPRSDWLEGEVTIVRDYLAGGGNLLWLADPGPLHGLEPIANELGINLEKGTLVDPTGQLLGISHPAVIVVPDYPSHPVTRELTSLTIFPFARPVETTGEGEWQTARLLQSLSRSWSETGPLEGTIQYEEESDLAGPLTLGLALTRAPIGAATDKPAEETPAAIPKQQRVLVIGDGDFLANSYLAQAANLELANRLVEWLGHDDTLITIPPRLAKDTRLEMTATLNAVLGIAFLAGVPLVLLGSGLAIWWRRRKR